MEERSDASKSPLYESIRSDADGTSELIEFLGKASERVFGVTYLPLNPPSIGVVICPSIAADFAASYRWEVNQARHLSARGVAVQRFHYRGTGHSDGAAPAMTFTTMCEDALRAVANLRDVAGIQMPVILGIRVGALVAAEIAMQTESPIVLIEPVADSMRFFREGFRARLVHDVKEQRESRSHPNRGMIDELKAEGFLDLLGHAVYRALFESMKALQLADYLLKFTGKMLMVQFGASGQLRPDLQALVSAAKTMGVCDTEFSPRSGSWWFVRDEDDLGWEASIAVTDWISSLSAGNTE